MGFTFRNQKIGEGKKDNILFLAGANLLGGHPNAATDIKLQGGRAAQVGGNQMGERVGSDPIILEGRECLNRVWGERAGRDQINLEGGKG